MVLTASPPAPAPSPSSGWNYRPACASIGFTEQTWACPRCLHCPLPPGGQIATTQQTPGGGLMGKLVLRTPISSMAVSRPSTLPKVTPCPRTKQAVSSAVGEHLWAHLETRPQPSNGSQHTRLPSCFSNSFVAVSFPQGKEELLSASNCCLPSHLPQGATL